MYANQINPSVVGAIIGGLIGAVSSFALGFIIFCKQLNKERSFTQLQKIEKIILLINKLLHRVEIILKSQKAFFLNPDKYYQRDHPEGEYFENYDDYYEYEKNTNGQIFKVKFYEDFEILKSYVLMFLPKFTEKINQIESEVLEVNPLLYLARDVDNDYFLELKKHLDSISDSLKAIYKEILASIHKDFTNKI